MCNKEAVRIPKCPICRAEAHRLYSRAKMHGGNCRARIEKKGKDIDRFTLKGHVTNYIY